MAVWNFQDGKSRRLSYGFAGKQQTFAPGVYPDGSLKIARLTRGRIPGTGAQGIGTGELRKADKVKSVRGMREACCLPETGQFCGIVMAA